MCGGVGVEIELHNADSVPVVALPCQRNIYFQVVTLTVHLSLCIEHTFGTCIAFQWGTRKEGNTSFIRSYHTVSCVVRFQSI